MLSHTKVDLEYIKFLMELLDDISQFTQRTKPYNRDTVLIKDMHLLLWQIFNEGDASYKNA